MTKALLRIASKLESLLDKLNAIADNELTRRKSWPFPVDFYGPHGTEIRFPDVKPTTVDISWTDQMGMPR